METEIIETEENKMKHVLKEILSISIYLLLVFCAAYLIVTYVGQRTQVSGSSMETTLSDGDHLIVDKISYRFEDPERFDIIVFPYQYDTDTYYIKRIIGMPGETVQIDDRGNIYVDGELLEEAYGREVIQNPGRAELYSRRPGREQGPGAGGAVLLRVRHGDGVRPRFRGG